MTDADLNSVVGSGVIRYYPGDHKKGVNQYYNNFTLKKAIETVRRRADKTGTAALLHFSPWVDTSTQEAFNADLERVLKVLRATGLRMKGNKIETAISPSQKSNPLFRRTPRKEVSLEDIRQYQEEEATSLCRHHDFSGAKRVIKQRPASYARARGLRIEGKDTRQEHVDLLKRLEARGKKAWDAAEKGAKKMAKRANPTTYSRVSDIDTELYRIHIYRIDDTKWEVSSQLGHKYFQSLEAAQKYAQREAESFNRVARKEKEMGKRSNPHSGERLEQVQALARFKSQEHKGRDVFVIHHGRGNLYDIRFDTRPPINSGFVAIETYRDGRKLRERGNPISRGGVNLPSIDFEAVGVRGLSQDGYRQGPVALLFPPKSRDDDISSFLDRHNYLSQVDSLLHPSTIKRGWRQVDLKNSVGPLRKITLYRIYKRRNPVGGPSRWIQDSIKRPGALHRKLGVPEGQDIPARLLTEAINHPERFEKTHAAQMRLKREAVEARTLKGLHHRGRKANPLGPILRKSNPNDISERDLYQSFHGKPSSGSIITDIPNSLPSSLTELGALTEIKLSSGSILGFDGQGIRLCSNGRGTQLYITGTVTFPADALKDFDTSKDTLDLGPVTYIVYRTKKAFDNFKEYEYKHKLGEESGDRPALIYDRRNRRLILAGGNYEVRPEGIVD